MEFHHPHLRQKWLFLFLRINNLNWDVAQSAPLQCCPPAFHLESPKFQHQQQLAKAQCYLGKRSRVQMNCTLQLHSTGSVRLFFSFSPASHKGFSLRDLFGHRAVACMSGRQSFQAAASQKEKEAFWLQCWPGTRILVPFLALPGLPCAKILRGANPRREMK